MTPVEARSLIETMASNSQQFSARNDVIVIREVHEVAINSSSSDLCPSVQQSEAIEQPEAYAANIYNRPPQPQQQNQPQQNNYDLSNNRYNPGWRNHPNLRWSNPSQQQQQQQQPYFQNVAGPSRPCIGQLATQLNQQQSQNFDRLPSQSVQNPKNLSVITLRSGKQCQRPQPTTSSSSANEPAQLHSTPKKDDDKNLKSKLPNNFYASESKEKQHIPLSIPSQSNFQQKNGRGRERDLGNI
ncbi:hypothetical protein GmHk_20G057592 [Glycine max]|nr:hypothetical protein GmHk_20G057592 [Glycine max]